MCPRPSGHCSRGPVAWRFFFVGLTQVCWSALRHRGSSAALLPGPRCRSCLSVLLPPKAAILLKEHARRGALTTPAAPSSLPGRRPRLLDARTSLFLAAPPLVFLSERNAESRAGEAVAVGFRLHFRRQ